MSWPTIKWLANAHGDLGGFFSHRPSLKKLPTYFNISLGNENESKEAVRNASADLMGFERELQVMEKEQVIVTATYKDVPLPVQVPEYDGIGE
tara:strand:- start:185 stop:463 length:279 start_codon:yes stop_codon:yes gene_type:complete